MISWISVLTVVALGWGLARLLGGGDRGPVVLANAVVWGSVGQVVWMAALDLAGVRWSALVLAAPAVAVTTVAIIATRRRATGGNAAAGVRHTAAERRWGLVALAAAGVHAAAVASLPAFGWDFRYMWGLKARVFALAGRHDPGWLAWGPNGLLHPSYPLLWPDLLAASATGGAAVTASAAAWQAVVVTALAAACWACTRGAAAPARALAAVVGAWAPVLFWPRYSGYAEPLLCLFLVVALRHLDAIADAGLDAMPTLAVSVAALALVKDEGMALALGVVLAAVVTARWRRSLPVLCAGLVPVLCWQIFLVHAGIGRGEFVLSLPVALRHLREFPRALLVAVTPKMALVVLVGLLAAPGVRGPRLRGVRVALSVWAVAVAGAYLTTGSDLSWHLFTSLDRVLAVPLPAVVAFSLRTGWPAAATSSGAEAA